MESHGMDLRLTPILIVIIAALRNELHKLWDDCFYSPEQRNRFRLVPLYIYRALFQLVSDYIIINPIKKILCIRPADT